MFELLWDALVSVYYFVEDGLGYLVQLSKWPLLTVVAFYAIEQCRTIPSVQPLIDAAYWQVYSFIFAALHIWLKICDGITANLFGIEPTWS